MLEIYPVETKKEQEAVCRSCGMEYRVEAMCYAAYTDGVLSGACQFVIREKSGYILSIRNSSGADDRDALFIMGRATLNFIDLCGVHSAYYTNDKEEDAELLKRIGFRKNDGDRWFMDLTGFFEAPCQHGNVK